MDRPYNIRPTLRRLYGVRVFTHKYTHPHTSTNIALHRFTTVNGPELTRTLFRVVKLLLPAAYRNLLAP